MTLKKTYPAPASLFSLAGHGLENLPEELQEEALEFIQRNTLSGTNENSGGALKPLYCPRCLKAHILKKAKEMNNAIKIRGNVGHNGYYLNGDVIVKI